MKTTLSRMLSLGAALGVSGGISMDGAALRCALSSAQAAVCNVPSGAYATIQSAANDAACTEIIIAAGTFTEQVTVGRAGGIFMHGAGQGRTIIKSPTTRAASTYPTTFYPNYTYIIQVPPATAADIADLTVDGTGNSFCGEPLFGVRFNNANGSLTRVTVDNVRAPGADFGCQNTVAIAVTGESGAGGAGVTVTNCTVRQFQKVGILANGNATNAIINNNVVRGVGAQTFQAQNGIQVSRGARGQVAYNLVSGAHFTGDTCTAGESVASGILSYQAGAFSIISNVAQDNDVGIYLQENTGNQTVYKNRLNLGYAGIYSHNNATGVVNITANGVTGTRISPAVNAATCFPMSGNGITVVNESGTYLSVNALADNARSGIEFYPTATGTTATQNQSTRSARVDLEDRGATSSITLNSCVSSTPTGLCAYPP